MRTRNSHTTGYDAFISYSHALRGELAATLQTWLERFATPWYRPRTLRIFRDYTSLSVSDDLGQVIEKALQASSWLILLASPEAARSPWVNREVAWWREHKAADRVCIVLTGGELWWSDGDDDWDWARTTALPPGARGMFQKEPLWVDLSSVATPRELDRSNPVLLNSVARIAAPLRGVDKDQLVGEHITLHRRARRQRRGGIVGLALLTAAALVASVLAIVQASNANRQRRTAERQRDIATSRQLAANADLVADTDPQLASLLSVTAFGIRDTPEARTSLVRQLANQSRASAHIDRFLNGSAGPLSGIAFSPDLRTLATGGDKVELWDWTVGNRLATLDTSGRFVAFSPAGRTLAVSNSEEVGLWDVAQRTKVATYPTDSGRVAPAIGFSPDGARIAIGGGGYDTGERGRIEIWDVATRTKIASLSAPQPADGPPLPAGHSGVMFSQDGTKVVADGQDEGPNDSVGVLVWDVKTGVKRLPFRGSDPCFPFSVAISPDNDTIAAGCSGHSARIVVGSMTRGTELGVLKADGDVGGLAFSPDGRTLVSADSGRHVIIWDVAKRTRIETLTAHTDEVDSIAISTDGRAMASAGFDGKVVVWRIGSRSAISSSHLPGTGFPAAFSPDGKALAVNGGDDGTPTTVWNTSHHSRLATLPGSGSIIGFSNNGHVVRNGNGDLSTWAVPEGRRTATLGIPPIAGSAASGPYGERPVALSSERGTLATVVADGKKIVLWDVARNAQTGSLPAENGVSSLAFAPSGTVLAVGESGGGFVVWDVPGTKRLVAPRVDTRGGSVVVVAVSPDGRTVASLQPAGQPQTASGCFGCEVLLWSADKVTPIAALSGHTVKPDYVAFSADGQMLASSGGNETILWSVPQRARLATVSGAGPLIFSPAGHLLATGRLNSDGKPDGALLWDTNPASWRERLCAMAGRNLTRDEWNAYVPERAYRPVCSSPASSTPHAARTTEAPGGLPSSERSSPLPSAGPTSIGLVDLSAVVAEPAAQNVARMLNTYFVSINKGDYDAALAMYDSRGVIDPNNTGHRDAFKRSVSTSQDSNVRLLSLTQGTTSPVAIVAVVEFRSTQALRFGPASDPNQTCTLWTLTYSLSEPAPHEYRILRGSGSHKPC